MQTNRLLRKGLAVGIFFLLIGIAVFPSVASGMKEQFLTRNDSNSINVGSLGKTIYVDVNNKDGPWDGTRDHPYQYINDGVNAACSRDTVYVFSGTYQEGYIQIDKSIKLIGENRDQTIIDGTGHLWILILYADNIRVEGFTIENCDTFDYPYDAAVWIREGKFDIISGNRFIHNNYASLVSTSFNIFYNNIIMDNIASIWINSGGFNIIFKNHFQDNTYGLLFEGTPSRCNIVMKNNFINTPDGYFNRARFTRWINNYWGDNITGPKFINVIIGYILIGLGPDAKVITIHGFQVDWHPAKEPFNIL